MPLLLMEIFGDVLISVFAELVIASSWHLIKFIVRLILSFAGHSNCWGQVPPQAAQSCFAPRVPRQHWTLGQPCMQNDGQYDSSCREYMLELAEAVSIPSCHTHASSSLLEPSVPACHRSCDVVILQWSYMSWPVVAASEV